jgi:ethanolamine utilization microcompartment shell protein EutS
MLHVLHVTVAQVVGKPTADSPKEKFVQDMVAVISKVCQAEVQQEDIAVKVGGTNDTALVCVLTLLPTSMPVVSPDGQQHGS